MKAIAVLSTPVLACPAGYIGGHMFHNSSDETVYLAIDGDSAVTASTGIPIAPGQTFFHEPAQFSPKGPPALYLIHAGTGSKSVRYGNTNFVAA